VKIKNVIIRENVILVKIHQIIEQKFVRREIIVEIKQYFLFKIFSFFRTNMFVSYVLYLYVYK
jgi:hypothetical protein